MNYNIISSGSCGNAILLNEIVLIDCGVSFKAIKSLFRNIKIVLLTHIHSDHFNKSTVKKLSSERPTLRFGCCSWLVPELIACGVDKRNIDVYEIGKIYNYGKLKISPVKLYHDVENCGYRIFYENKKAIYCTDTNTLEGISAKDYDLYLIECNYEDDEINNRIDEKINNGEYAYEIRAKNNHLSKSKCDDFIFSQGGDCCNFVYLHQHKE